MADELGELPEFEDEGDLSPGPGADFEEAWNDAKARAAATTFPKTPTGAQVKASGAAARSSITGEPYTLKRPEPHVDFVTWEERAASTWDGACWMAGCGPENEPPGVAALVAGDLGARIDRLYCWWALNADRWVLNKDATPGVVSKGITDLLTLQLALRKLDAGGGEKESFAELLEGMFSSERAVVYEESPEAGGGKAAGKKGRRAEGGEAE